MILICVSFLIASMLTLIIGIPYIAFLKKNVYEQFILEDAPSSHAKKAGTPTMGGIIIAVPAILASVLALVMNQSTSVEALVILSSFALFMILGFKDDLCKILKKQNKGLTPGKKLVFQFLIALIPAMIMTVSGKTTISFYNYFSINLSYIYPVFATVLIVGMSNAVNLTDGLDGLASGLSVIAFFALAIITCILGRNDLAIVAIAIAGSCVAFLYYNKYPAKMFMGDTGSLSLGGALGTFAVVSKLEIVTLLIGIVFVLETLSVIIQVISFKTTGKRVFKMSPIHHHFELLGWDETRVVKVFCAVGLISSSLIVLLYVYKHFIQGII